MQIILIKSAFCGKPDFTLGSCERVVLCRNKLLCTSSGFAAACLLAGHFRSQLVQVRRWRNITILVCMPIRKRRAFGNEEPGIGVWVRTNCLVRSASMPESRY